jgi:AraC-like DNA-binding protein
MPRETGKARRTGDAWRRDGQRVNDLPGRGRPPEAPHRPGERSSGSACRAERREQLLAAATRAFARGGFAATSLDDIAERAGISRVLLYRHFDPKTALPRQTRRCPACSSARALSLARSSPTVVTISFPTRASKRRPMGPPATR